MAWKSSLSKAMQELRWACNADSACNPANVCNVRLQNYFTMQDTFLSNVSGKQRCKVGKRTSSRLHCGLVICKPDAL
jgi:hypothetical protein